MLTAGMKLGKYIHQRMIHSDVPDINLRRVELYPSRATHATVNEYNYTTIIANKNLTASLFVHLISISVRLKRSGLKGLFVNFTDIQTARSLVLMAISNTAFDLFVYI